MISILGFLCVTICVIGGYILEGGKMHVLFQPIELLIIFGAALGGMIASCSFSLLKNIVLNVVAIIAPSTVSKEKYTQTLQLIYELFKVAAGNPLALEAHVENPENSDVFKKYPLVLHDHHAVPFLANTLSLIISASIASHDLDDMLENDITVIHEEEMMVPKTINRVADALPGLGIVAAVLGIVITMGKLAQGKETIGHSVAAALVGTFLGVLLSYGFFQPLGARIETNLVDKGKILYVIKAAVLAYSRGCNAQICAEFARRMIPEEFRISYKELDATLSSIQVGKPAA